MSYSQAIDDQAGLDEQVLIVCLSSLQHLFDILLLPSCPRPEAPFLPWLAIKQSGGTEAARIACLYLSLSSSTGLPALPAARV